MSNFTNTEDVRTKYKEVIDIFFQKNADFFKKIKRKYRGSVVITYDDGKWSLEEAIGEVEDELKNNPEYSDEWLHKEWEEVDKSCAEDVCEFMTGMLHWEGIYGVVYVENVKRVTPFTGAFITKRACKNYIEKYGYNHNDPHTYAMTAYRNFELERLLKILREIKLN